MTHRRRCAKWELIAPIRQDLLARAITISARTLREHKMRADTHIMLIELPIDFHPAKRQAKEDGFSIIAAIPRRRRVAKDPRNYQCTARG